MFFIAVFMPHREGALRNNMSCLSHASIKSQGDNATVAVNSCTTYEKTNNKNINDSNSHVTSHGWVAQW